MSLMNLLAVGRSIWSIRDKPSPFKMSQQNLLPKFGAGKGPETKADGASAPHHPELQRLKKKRNV